MNRLSFHAVLLSGLCCGATTTAHRPIAPDMTLVANDGLCANEDASPFPLIVAPGDPAHLWIWGGACYARDATRKAVFAQTSTFRAPQFLRIYTQGWGDSPKLFLERVSDGERYLLMPRNPHGQVWSLCNYDLPPDWRGREVRLVVEEKHFKGLWRAFSEPLEGDTTAGFGDAWHLLSLASLHFFVMASGALAITIGAMVYGLRDKIYAGLLLLVAMALPGYAFFWLTLFNAKLASYLAVAAMIASVFAMGFGFRKLDPQGRAILKLLGKPLLLTAIATIMVLASGFLYGGTQDSLGFARSRYLELLPPDNEMPFLFANGARLPHVPTPLFGNWLSSDRPPLQSGMVLAQFPLFRKPRELNYTIVSMLAQSLWILGLWLLLTAFGVDGPAASLAIAACLFSSFVFTNTFFVWPKLLSAACTLGFFAAFVRAPEAPAPRWLKGLLPGALCALAMLAHGGSFFALLPGVPAILLWKRSPAALKQMAATVFCAILFYAPWSAYQTFYDPPGNRLLNLHFAGVEAVDGRSFSQAFMDAYGQLPMRQLWANKESNFESAFGNGLENLQATLLMTKDLFRYRKDGWANAASLGYEIRQKQFFYPAATLGFFLFAPFALLLGVFQKRFRSAAWRVSGLLWIFIFAAMTIWCLLMFGPHATSIHQGSYALTLMMLTAGVLAYWSISRTLAIVTTAAQAMIGFLLNEVLLRVPYPSGVLPEGLVHWDTFVLLASAVAGVAWLLRETASDATPLALQPTR